MSFTSRVLIRLLFFGATACGSETDPDLFIESADEYTHSDADEMSIYEYEDIENPGGVGGAPCSVRVKIYNQGDYAHPTSQHQYTGTAEGHGCTYGGGEHTIYERTRSCAGGVCEEVYCPACVYTTNWN